MELRGRGAAPPQQRAGLSCQPDTILGAEKQGRTVASWEGWRILLFLNEGFLFGRALEMTLSYGTTMNLDRGASSKVYRSLLEEILRRDCFPGAQVEVLILPTEQGFQHHLSGPGGLTRGRREEAVSKLYRKVYELWRSQEWLVRKGTGLPN